MAVALSLLGQLAVIYFPPLQYIFQTEALAFEDLVLLACLSSSVFIICEAKKLLQRYYSQGKLNKNSIFSRTTLAHHSGRKRSGHIV